MPKLEDFIEAPFTVRGNVLQVEGDMFWEGVACFEKACGRLLESPAEKLELDLSAVGFVASSFLGSIASLAQRALRLGKRVKIRATLDTGWLFEIMGGGKLLELEIMV